jgi:hypothetical protein
MMNRPSLRSQSGQLIVEAVLIIAVFLSITMMTVKMFKDNEVVKNLIHGPWQSMAGILQNGVWGPPSRTNASHPTGHFRHIIVEGEAVK